MRKYILSFIFCIISFSPLYSQVTCNVFDVDANINNGALSILLNTDLPQNTDLQVSARRPYWEKGDTTTYAISYFSKDTNAGKLISGQTFKINKEKWKADLQKQLNLEKKTGLGGDVSKISKYVNIWFLVSTHQPNPKFGKNNSKLDGKYVKKEFGVNEIDKTVKVYHPLNESTPVKSRLANHSNLKVGESYILSRKTPLMAEDPISDPYSAMQHIKQIPKGSIITVISITRDQSSDVNNIIYKVKAYYSNGKLIRKGRITEVALIGQTIKNKN